MLKVTRWSPDTCGCVLEYDWDDTKEGADRVHTFKKVIKLCPEHESLGFQGKAAYNQVMSENQGKNRAWGLIKQELNLADEDLDKYVWFFNASRQLQVSVTLPIAVEKKQQIQAKLDALLGEGKAKVV